MGLGVIDRIWAVLLKACEDLGGCDWEWQAADGAMGKATHIQLIRDLRPPGKKRYKPRRK